MNDGIGRAGYRLLAGAFLLFGLLGLGLNWYGLTKDLKVIGIAGGVGAAAVMVLLFVFTLITPNEPRPRVHAPQAEPVAKPTGSSDLKWEAPVAPSPSGPEAPTPMRIMELDGAGAPVGAPRGDPAAWPGDSGPSTWSVERKARANAEERASKRRQRDELTDRYTKTTPQVREILMSASGNGVATRPERPVGTVAVDEGKSRGKCGGCGTILLAPKRRPIRLRCPTCHKVTTLSA